MRRQGGRQAGRRQGSPGSKLAEAADSTLYFPLAFLCPLYPHLVKLCLLNVTCKQLTPTSVFPLPLSTPCSSSFPLSSCPSSSFLSYPPYPFFLPSIPLCVPLFFPLPTQPFVALFLFPQVPTHSSSRFPLPSLPSLPSLALPFVWCCVQCFHLTHAAVT